MAKSPPLFAIAMVSASALAYEVLLLRLFSIIQWHHFAYMIISLALLGYGASGTFLAVAGKRIHSRFTFLFCANATLFGLGTMACFWLAQKVSFNPMELLWDSKQPLRLCLVYLILSFPFFFAANCIGICFYRFREQTGRIYGADLFGAGLGAGAAVGLLFVLSPVGILKIIGAAGLAAAVPAARQDAEAGRLAAVLPAALSLAFLLALASERPELRISSYKGLSQTLQTTGASVIEERSGPLGVITAVENETVPFRYAPGLSLTTPEVPPEQIGLFTDAESSGVVNRVKEEEKPPSFVDYMTSALPYHLLERPKVLILGAGGGTEVVQALFHDARQIDAVELNRQVVDLVRGEFREFAGGIYNRKNVRIHIGEARGFAETTDDLYDLIQVALLDAFGASTAGLHALTENYLYTVEALKTFVDRLSPSGILSLTRWIKLPPRDTLKLLATAVEALRSSGVKEPGQHLALIRSWNTATLLVKKAPFTAQDVMGLRRFCKERFFDPAYFPGISENETNRFNILERPYFYEAARSLVGDRVDDFISRYKYDIRPATDDRPYFYNFFTWSLLPELFMLRARGGFGLLEWGYPVLAATLIQAFFASILLVLLPLRLISPKEKGSGKGSVFIYFAALGLAFLFLEIVFIQKFILFLSHPIYAVSAVLCAFLVFAGLGSLYAGRISRDEKRAVSSRPILGPVTGIVALALSYRFLLPFFFQWLMPLPIPVKAFISVLLISPLAFLMGMPFPLGLARLGGRQPGLISWAWGINGCASVLSAVTATLLAIHFGFEVVVFLAAGLYMLAAVVYGRLGRIG